MTLNSHFTQLILMPEAQTLLVNLHKVIAEQVRSVGDDFGTILAEKAVFMPVGNIATIIMRFL